jgi:hypothetical protein
MHLSWSDTLVEIYMTVESRNYCPLAISSNMYCCFNLLSTYVAHVCVYLSCVSWDIRDHITQVKP